MEESQLTSKSKDIEFDNISKLKELFPQIVVEDKVDFDTLKTLLGESIDDNDEKYKFIWPGKTLAIKESQKPSTGTLRPSKENSVHWDKTRNIYIEGDNLEVLKLLQKAYYNRIKCIYIDPPYNTGKDFIYADNYKDNLENYLKLSGQVKDDDNIEGSIKLTTNIETAGRFHTNWLNMMYPRLKLARNLLTDDGVIFISIDDNEVENLKKICNEIFGETNFIGQLTWLKKRKGSFLSKNMVSLTEYILIYGRNKGIGLYGGEADTSESQPLIKRTNSIKKLNFPKNQVKTKLKDGLYPKGTYGEGTSSVNLLNDVTISNGLIINDFSLEGPFIWTQENLDNELKRGSKLVINTKKFQVRAFKVPKEGSYKGLNSFINGIEIRGTNEDGYEELKRIFSKEKIMDYPKPINLIKLIIESATHFDEDCIILDFFSGSATTAHAVLELNLENKTSKKFINVQIPEETDEKSAAFKAGYKNICEIGEERIRRAGDEILEKSDNKNLDIGFKVFKLDSSNLKKWEPEFSNVQQSLIIDEIKKDRTNEDLVYEIMLKYGVDLTLPIERHGNIYSIGYGALVICLEDNITKEITNKILEIVKDSSIVRVVFKDSGFASDADKTNIKEILKTNHIDEFITI